MPYVDGEYRDSVEIIHECHCNDGYITDDNGEQMMFMVCAGEGKLFYTKRKNAQSNTIYSDMKPYHGSNQGCLVSLTILVGCIASIFYFLL